MLGDEHKITFANGGDVVNKNVLEKDMCKKLNIEMKDGLGDKIQSSSNLINKK